MINCIKNKSFSYSQLKSDSSNPLKQSQPYFLYRVGAGQPANQVLATKLKHPTFKHSPPKNSPLQMFKSRLTRGLKDIRQAQNVRRNGQKPKFCNIKINDMLVEAEQPSIFKRSTCDSVVIEQQQSPISRKTVFRYFNDLICPKKNQERLNKIYVRGREERSNSSSQELTFTKSNSIMIIRKVNKSNDRFVQNRKDKYQEQFHRIKEVPIHHSQYYLTKKARIRTEGIASKYRKAVNSNIQNAISDIINLRDTLRDNQIYQQRRLEVCVKGKSNMNSSGSLVKIKTADKHVKNKSQEKLDDKEVCHNNFVKKIRKISANREEVGQFGPWVRKKTNDFDSIF